LKEDDWTEQETLYFVDGNGGNKAFFEFMKKYGMEGERTQTKYCSYAATYYAKKVECKVN